MNNFCIYRHIRLDTNKVFYIGIGNSKRPYVKNTRSDFWKNITNKTKYEVQILKSNLTKEEAIELEKILISYYGRINNKTGILCNLTDGGEGALGVVVSNKTKLKLSESRFKKVINMETGEIFKNASCVNTKIKPSYFNSMLNNGRRNITPFKYLKDKNNDKIKYNQSKIIEIKGNSVIDITTGVTYQSVAKAARIYNLNATTLYSYLSNKRTNKTNLRFYNE